MAIERIRIDYTVYSPNYKPGEGLCLSFDTFQKAKLVPEGLVQGRELQEFQPKEQEGGNTE